jgi:phosphatidylglycerol:prolipoprotein diacylglycerol transferase
VTVGYLSWRVDVSREFFGIPYFPHGVLIAVAFVLGGLLLNRYTRTRGVSTDILLDILFWVIFGSIAGTRLVWVAGNLDRMDSLAEVFMIWHGGMTLYGGILGGLIAGVIMLRRHGLPVLPMIDLAAPPMALGLVIGRISDLITGDHLGKPTDLPWGFRYVGTNPPGQAPPLGAVVHPVALYDALLVAVLFVILVLYLRKPRPAGTAAAIFALYYSVDRLFLDFLRTDRTRLFGLTGTQLASIAVIAVVGSWVLRRQRVGWRTAGDADKTGPAHTAAGDP